MRPDLTRFCDRCLLRFPEASGVCPSCGGAWRAAHDVARAVAEAPEADPRPARALKWLVLLLGTAFVVGAPLFALVAGYSLLREGDVWLAAFLTATVWLALAMGGVVLGALLISPFVLLAMGAEAWLGSRRRRARVTSRVAPGPVLSPLPSDPPEPPASGPADRLLDALQARLDAFWRGVREGDTGAYLLGGALVVTGIFTSVANPGVDAGDEWLRWVLGTFWGACVVVTFAAAALLWNTVVTVGLGWLRAAPRLHPGPDDQVATVDLPVDTRDRIARRHGAVRQGRIVSALGAPLFAPISGAECVAYRVVGAVGLLEVDDAEAAGFEVALDGGGRARVTVDHLLVDLAVGAGSTTLEGQHLARDFATARGLSHAGPFVGGERLLAVGDRVRILGDEAIEMIEGEGYRSQAQRAVLSGTAVAPLVLTDPSSLSVPA